MKAKILKLDVPDVNGITYTTSEIKKALENNRKAIEGMFIQFDNYPPYLDDCFDISKSKGVVKSINIEDQYVVIYFDFIENKKNNNAITDIYNNHGLECFPILTGQIDENGKVYDLELRSLTLTEPGSVNKGNVEDCLFCVEEE